LLIVLPLGLPRKCCLKYLPCLRAEMVWQEMAGIQF
jgi:hypothetical protein